MEAFSIIDAESDRAKIVRAYGSNDLQVALMDDFAFGTRALLRLHAVTRIDLNAVVRCGWLMKIVDWLDQLSERAPRDR